MIYHTQVENLPFTYLQMILKFTMNLKILTYFRVVNRELKKVKMWLDVNKLALNIDKTNFIIFKSPQHSCPVTVSIKIGSLPIRKTCYVTFLGVLLDENLSWKYHLTELLRIAYKDSCSNYEELLTKINIASIHHKKLQLLLKFSKLKGISIQVS